MVLAEPKIPGVRKNENPFDISRINEKALDAFNPGSPEEIAQALQAVNQAIDTMSGRRAQLLASRLNELANSGKVKGELRERLKANAGYLREHAANVQNEGSERVVELANRIRSSADQASAKLDEVRAGLKEMVPESDDDWAEKMRAEAELEKRNRNKSSNNKPQKTNRSSWLRRIFGGK